MNGDDDDREVPPELPLLHPVDEGARLLGISRATLYRLVAAGEIPIVRIGRSSRIRRKDLDDFINGLGGQR
jgi:excisionase family DNA binding protein